MDSQKNKKRKAIEKKTFFSSNITTSEKRMKVKSKKGLKLKWNSCVVQLIQIESISFDIGVTQRVDVRMKSRESVRCNDGKWSVYAWEV